MKDFDPKTKLASFAVPPSNAILSIEKNKSLKESMIENGYKHAQNFNDEIIARNLFKSYNSI